MTMPYGSAEEPDVILTEHPAVAVHVVSSDARPGKSIGTEFGHWRTVLVSSALGMFSVTPGAQRLVSRSLRRRRAILVVSSSGPVVTTPPVAGFPAIAVSGTAIQNPFAYPVSVVLAGFTATQVFVNGILSGAGNGTYIVPGFGTLSVTFTVLGVTTPNGIPASNPQSSFDGVIIGTREEITSGTPTTPGLLGGYIPIGRNVNYDAQPELWVAYPTTNTAPVYIAVCDEVYASDSEDWKETERE